MTARLALLVVAATATAAMAVAVPKGSPGSRPLLESADGSRLRAAPSVSWDRAPDRARKAWDRFELVEGGAWHALWDEGIGVPRRIYGSGIAAPGANASAAVAEAAARDVLARHIELLAPGAAAADFALAANDLDAGVRTVGLVQSHQGLRVLGGQVSFRFKKDRLFVIGSEAVPDVAIVARPSRVAPEAARAAARAWLARDPGGEVAVGAAETAAILPLFRPSGAVDLHVVIPVRVDSRRPAGRWSVYIDAASGRPVARRSLLRFGSGTILFDVPLRHPLAARIDAPAPVAAVTVGGAAARTDLDGVVTWPGGDPATVVPTNSGPQVAVLNAAGADVTTTLVVPDGGSAVWSAAGVEFEDAQLSAFIFVQTIKTWARGLNPELAWLDAALAVTVNIDDFCNAYSDGDTINFFRADAGYGCQNTARIADVVYHEFGHSFHNQSVIPGVGTFNDSALDEGVADYVAITVTGDPKMGRGFFLTDDPLRSLDEPDLVWPDAGAGGDYYAAGDTFAGAMWDLRVLLVAAEGEAAGVARADRLFYAAMRRASDVPSTYVEVIAADDDDGNLDNGTPNLCLIDDAFVRHGLAGPGAGAGVRTPVLDGRRLTLPVAQASACPGTQVSSAVLEWRARGEATSTTVALAAAIGGYTVDLPAQPDDSVLEYRVVVTLDGGAILVYPDNAADPWYQIYSGEVVPLYCTDFETDPALDGWIHGLTSGSPGEGADDWQWGAPLGFSESGDPGSAFSGDFVYGNDLGGGDFNGSYQPNKVNFASSPVIDTAGSPTVRVQLRRWLNVEDALYDHATIYANDQPVWGNLATDEGTTHHRDAEWRFQDLDLTPFVVDGKVQVRFEVASDGGLEFGGWTLDDFCVVGHPPPRCGDGWIAPGEECDDGGAVDGDGCSATCRLPACGDSVVDPGEACDEGGAATADCTASCSRPSGWGDDGCGCRAGGAPLPGAGLLVAFFLLLSRRPRRRR